MRKAKQIEPANGLDSKDTTRTQRSELPLHSLASSNRGRVDRELERIGCVERTTDWGSIKREIDPEFVRGEKGRATYLEKPVEERRREGRATARGRRRRVGSLPVCAVKEKKADADAVEGCFGGLSFASFGRKDATEEGRYARALPSWPP